MEGDHLTPRPVVSFIVPAHDEARLIGRTVTALDSAARDLGLPFEVIVVDDASSDGTAAIARACGARVVSVRVRQIACARNAGARVAAGDIFIFVDADTMVPAATVRATVDAVRRGAVGGGATVGVDGRLPIYARIILPLGRLVMRAGSWAAGCYVFCTRAAFDEVGGFDEALYASEEITFSRGLRRQGTFVILWESVTTSGRKLRTHSGWEILRLSVTLALSGRAGVRRRDGLALWYGARRDDL